VAADGRRSEEGDRGAHALGSLRPRPAFLCPECVPNSTIKDASRNKKKALESLI
jgi:hypothetical protein